LLIDEADAHHLVFTWRNGPTQLAYGTDACGSWQFTELDYGSVSEAAPPIFLPDGTIHIAYRAGYGLWRAILDPPNCGRN